MTKEAQKNVAAVEVEEKVEEKKEEKDQSNKYELTLENLFKAGVHFGHKKSRWNPKMEKYIFGVRGGVHIINLEKTLEMFKIALDFISEIVKKGENVMLVGTKKQVKELVKAVGQKAEIPYVNERWIGGTFTNFKVISKRTGHYLENKENLEKGRLAHLTKFEKMKLAKELEKIEEKMGGLIGMKNLPAAIFVLDICKDELAVKEAKKAGIKIIGLVDTNTNPELIDFPIPANDDAFSSLSYILGVFLKEVLKAKKEKPVTAGK
ncbi:MAG: 30S ribosomal protein S2 [Candidatus Moranbacteria bacterium]|jgi:small subunit ribosomal protein S2|nr:30S ribosomal protein S2 [Candidatus Moranbacteria bacterium]